ncbi:MAG: hypothetical protein HY706_02380 [Candidatus Hydrogenedentes bacterium]|nr:hypothetical protein [Candidatus Hydrogenedentota bacterium]
MTIQVLYRIHAIALSSLLAGFVSNAASELQDSPGAVSIGLRKQLLVDDYVIAAKENVTRALGLVTKANNGQPILVADRPWENADLLRFGTVIRDARKFRMWYLMNADLFGYAESEDGLHWQKPNLGQYEYQGSKENNIVDARGVSCFLDPHETDPAHKYKSAYGHPERIMACLAYSPDGFHWTSYNDGNPVTKRAADTMNQLIWDEEAKTYRLFTRTDYGEGRYGGTLNENRGTRDMTNSDIKSNPSAWTKVREWRFDHEGRWEFKRRQVYALNGWRHEGILFGLVWCYEWPGQLGEGPYDIQKRHERDIMNYYLVAARNDEPWDLSWVYAEQPFIPRGPDGSFDKDWIQPAGNIVTWNDQHWIYYCGSRERHDTYRIRESNQTRWQCAIGLATLPLDRFVCLAAGDTPGVITTKPFKLEGTRLLINADAAQGEIRTEVLDKTGQPIRGFTDHEAVTIKAVDNIRLEPRWTSQRSLRFLKNTTVGLRFHLTRAKLYAFQIAS